MTTKELKEYIGRVLGNSIRCILPSYWWKRLFGLVVDKVEEVEGSIVSSLDEFAKERPDIEDRTFYMSEDAELVAHNKNIWDKLYYKELGSTKVKPFYIATPIAEINGQIIWWIRSDGFEATGWGAGFSNIIIDDKKYNVLFLSDGSYISNEKPSDSITIDTEMSSTSENAVQNKVIKSYVDKSIKDYDQSISEAILGELDKKVDKIEGKQLSTEDFTTALKTKLEGMSSFDPTEINNKVDGLQSQINTLVSGDASTAIESFNEIIAFLNGVQDSESLEGIIAGIEQQIAAKQDKIADLEAIRSGAALGTTAIQSVKTINGESIVGDGNIEIKANVDTSTLATKDEVTSLSNEVVANEEVTAAALNELNERINAISENVSGETATKVELQTAVESLTNTILENEEVTAAALIDLDERVKEVSANVSGETATKVELQTAVESLTNTILENEEITAAALNDLDTRLNEILTRLTNAGI